jgi:diguanylate cyclase (GGDEF)-like protein
LGRKVELKVERMQLRHIANRLQGSAPTLDDSTVTAPAPVAPKLDAPDPRLILPSIGAVVYHWNLVTDRLTWGVNLAQTLGPLVEEELAAGLAYGACVSPESGGSRYDAILRSAASDTGEGVAYEAVYGLIPPREKGPGPTIWVEDTGRWFAGPDGRPAEAHGVVRVVTAQHEAERRRLIGAHLDSLTGLLSRAQFTEQTTRFLDASADRHKPFALILVAIENLFALNRSYGYDAGDAVIAGLAGRLRADVRAGDVLARYAGNKFAALLVDCDAEEMLAAAARLIDLVNDSAFETPAGPIPATVRIGGVVAPREGRTPQALFQHAEEALDVARQRAGRRFVSYTSSLARDDARLQALHVADSIVSALQDRRVELAFQPIVHAANGAVAFHEALLRMRLPDGSTVTPGALLPVAEKAGLVSLLDQRVMGLALTRLAAEPDLSVSVNCSMNTLLDPEWPDRLAQSLADRPQLASRLIVEITETAMIEDFASTRHLIGACKRLGVKVAMDDFGAGHTSFRNLRDLAFDIVKIDGAFIKNVVTSEDDRFFVRTLVDLARHLSLEVVAEWVEDETTAAILRDMGVTYFQGELFGAAAIPPVPLETTL